MPEIQLVKLLTVLIHLDKTCVLDNLGDYRSSSKILGGECHGDILQGAVTQGGSLFLADQHDGSARLSAYYNLLTDDGIIINAFAQGLVIFDDHVKRQASPNASVMGNSDYQCSCCTQFTTPTGAYERLQRNIYISRLRYLPMDRDVIMDIFEARDL